MKIVVLTGSPRPRGTTALLADEFCAGALEAGHQVTRFDIARKKVVPCAGCGYCEKNGGKCAVRDDMDEILPAVLEADALALVSPIYYYGLSAQLAAAVNRFHAASGVKLPALFSPKKALLLVAGADADPAVTAPLHAQLSAICAYLHWSEGGTVEALGCKDRAAVEKTAYPAQARALGRAL